MDSTDASPAMLRPTWRGDLTSEEMRDILDVSSSTLKRIVRHARWHRDNPTVPERDGYEGIPLPYRRGRNLYWRREEVERWVATVPVADGAHGA